MHDFIYGQVERKIVKVYVGGKINRYTALGSKYKLNKRHKPISVIHNLNKWFLANIV